MRHVFVLVFTICTAPAWGWGADAHRLIAELAERQLTPKALAEVRRLLSQEPGATMGSVSTWADEVRTRTDAAWHYVNLEPNSGCRYVSNRDCAGGNCVVDAIEQQLAILRSSNADHIRLRALKYVIHLVADVHQPLHAGHAHDRGGNLFQLQAFGRGTNLHATWDTDLVVNWPGGLTGLRQALGAKSASAGGAVPAAQWAEESCRIVEEPWFYPQSRRLDDAYQDKASPIVRDRIAVAASRLSSALVAALDR